MYPSDAERGSGLIFIRLLAKHILLFEILLGISVQAKAKEAVHKSWKTFKSDVGYQLKYPDCWEIIIDSPDESGPMDTIRNIFIRERPPCSTKRLSKDVDPNGIGIAGGYGPRQRRSDAIKEIELRESVGSRR
jgi:hypothetical protein